MLKPADLHDYQVKAYKDILRDKVFAICDRCGGGKSIICLSACAVLKRKSPKSKMLIVCTPKGIKNAWSNEYLNWTHTKSLRVAVLNGNPKQRQKLLDGNNHDIYAISYNSLEWLVDNNKYIKFDFVFADEADCLKGTKSKWRKWLIKASRHAKYKILASATPKAKDEIDYWGLCKYLDNGKALDASTITEFRAMYCTHFKVGYHLMYKIRKDKIAEVERRIKHLFRNYGEKSIDEIPIKTINAMGKLSEASKEIYKKLQDEQCVNSVVLKDGKLDTDASLPPMTLSGKLNQLSSGFLYVDDSLRIDHNTLVNATDAKQLLKDITKRQVVDVFDDRIKAIKKLVGKVRKKHNCPIAIAYTFQHELVQLQRAFPDGVSDIEDDIEGRWNRDEIDTLFLQYSRSSKSLNLQKGSGHVLVKYSPTFKWVDDYQIDRRFARQGQKAECVYVYRLYIKGTIDDVKTKSLKERFIGHSRFQKQIIQEI